MNGETSALPTLKPPQDLRQSLRRLRRLCQKLGEARTKSGLSAEDVLIFMALGQLSLSPSCEMSSARPVTYSAIAEALKIPKETVRRKVGRLIGGELVRSTPRGLMIADIDEWLQFIAPFQIESGTVSVSPAA